MATTTDNQSHLQAIDYSGRLTASGDLRTYEDDMAVSNDIVIFISLKKGDVIYDPQSGGILDTAVFRLMTDDNTKAITDQLKEDLQTEFGGVAQFKSIQVNPNKQTRTYEIIVTYQSLLTNKPNTVIFNSATKPVNEVVVTFTDVPYTGENLLNFVLVKKFDNKNLKLTMDEVSGYWIWGQYRLINLKNTDYNFQTLFNIINSS